MEKSLYFLLSFAMNLLLLLKNKVYYKKKKGKACFSCSRNSKETTVVSLQWKRGIERGAGAQPPKASLAKERSVKMSLFGAI